MLARRFHKFFNLHEVDEASPRAIGPLPRGSRSSLRLKLDGSLASPLLLPASADGGSNGGGDGGGGGGGSGSGDGGSGGGEQLVWATRGRPSDAIAAHVGGAATRRGARHAALARHWLRRGVTPLYEWCEARRAAGLLRHEVRCLPPPGPALSPLPWLAPPPKSQVRCLPPLRRCATRPMG